MSCCCRGDQNYPAWNSTAECTHLVRKNFDICVWVPNVRDRNLSFRNRGLGSLIVYLTFNNTASGTEHHLDTGNVGSRNTNLREPCRRIMREQKTRVRITGSLVFRANLIAPRHQHNPEPAFAGCGQHTCEPTVPLLPTSRNGIANTDAVGTGEPSSETTVPVTALLGGASPSWAPQTPVAMTTVIASRRPRNIS
jgi:hypothetical protein